MRTEGRHRFAHFEQVVRGNLDLGAAGTLKIIGKYRPTDERT